MQLKHSENRFLKRKFPIVLVCDKIRTPENIGMILRVAESFGVEKIVFDKESPSPNDRSVKRISRDTNKTMKFEMSENVQGDLITLRNKGYQIVALEITSDSKNIEEVEHAEPGIVLVIGAERNGISKVLLDLCHEKYHIEMFGDNSSMNVVNALSIALYEVTKKLRG